MRIEYGNGIGVIAYTMASAIGIMRVYNDWHWIHDVISGAGIGIFSAKMGSWMLPVWKKIFNCKKDSTISVVPYANPNGKTYSLTACMII